MGRWRASALRSSRSTTARAAVAEQAVPRRTRRRPTMSCELRIGDRHCPLFYSVVQLCTEGPLGSQPFEGLLGSQPFLTLQSPELLITVGGFRRQPAQDGPCGASWPHIAPCGT